MVQSNKPGRLVAWLLLLLATGAGCSGKARTTTTITGKVTYKGAPVSVGAIYIHGANGQVAMGNIGEDGSFTATDVPLGEARVSLQVRDPGAYARQLTKGGGTPQDKSPAGGPTRVTSVPAKYADPNTSERKFLIEDGMSNLEVKLD